MPVLCKVGLPLNELTPCGCPFIPTALCQWRVSFPLSTGVLAVGATSQGYLVCASKGSWRMTFIRTVPCLFHLEVLDLCPCLLTKFSASQMRSANIINHFFSLKSVFTHLLMRHCHVRFVLSFTIRVGCISTGSVLNSSDLSWIWSEVLSPRLGNPGSKLLWPSALVTFSHLPLHAGKQSFPKGFVYLVSRVTANMI